MPRSRSRRSSSYLAKISDQDVETVIRQSVVRREKALTTLRSSMRQCQLGRDWSKLQVIQALLTLRQETLQIVSGIRQWREQHGQERVLEVHGINYLLHMTRDTEYLSRFTALSETFGFTIGHSNACILPIRQQPTRFTPIDQRNLHTARQPTQAHPSPQSSVLQFTFPAHPSTSSSVQGDDATSLNGCDGADNCKECIRRLREGEEGRNWESQGPVANTHSSRYSSAAEAERQDQDSAELANALTCLSNVSPKQLAQIAEALKVLETEYRRVYRGSLPALGMHRWMCAPFVYPESKPKPVLTCPQTPPRKPYVRPVAAPSVHTGSSSLARRASGSCTDSLRKSEPSNAVLSHLLPFPRRPSWSPSQTKGLGEGLSCRFRWQGRDAGKQSEDSMESRRENCAWGLAWLGCEILARAGYGAIAQQPVVMSVPQKVACP